MDKEKPRDIFRRAGITQQAVADLFGITQGAITQWRRVPAEKVLPIEAAFPVLSRHKLRPDLYPTDDRRTGQDRRSGIDRRSGEDRRRM